MIYKKAILRSAVSAVAFIFTMFGGFFLKVAPPEEVDAKFAVGITSFCVLVTLLVISNLRPKGRQQKSRPWLRVAILSALIGTAAGCVYKYTLDRFTFPWPPESKNQRFATGSVLTSRALAYQRENPEKAESVMVADFGGVMHRDLIWTSSSIENIKWLMLGTYLLMVLGLATGVFCLIEQSATRVR
jgi:hypothetical protein